MILKCGILLATFINNVRVTGQYTCSSSSIFGGDVYEVVYYKNKKGEMREASFRGGVLTGESGFDPSSAVCSGVYTNLCKQGSN